MPAFDHFCCTKLRWALRTATTRHADNAAWHARPQSNHYRWRSSLAWWRWCSPFWGSVNKEKLWVMRFGNVFFKGFVTSCLEVCCVLTCWSSSVTLARTTPICLHSLMEGARPFSSLLERQAQMMSWYQESIIIIRYSMQLRASMTSNTIHAAAAGHILWTVAAHAAAVLLGLFAVRSTRQRG